jgi:hypothetical protein
MAQVSLSDKKAAFEVMLQSREFESVVTHFPKYRLIIPLILFYLCSFKPMPFPSPDVKFPKYSNSMG